MMQPGNFQRQMGGHMGGQHMGGQMGGPGPPHQMGGHEG